MRSKSSLAICEHIVSNRKSVSKWWSVTKASLKLIYMGSSVTAKIVVGSLFTLYYRSCFFCSPINASGDGNHSAYKQQIPTGLPEGLWRKLVPVDNPMTEEKVALGRVLYFDKRLSLGGTVSCATCHDPGIGFADHNPLAIGVNGRVGTRNAAGLLNTAFSEFQFWDGRARNLEEQAKQPLINAVEMGMESYDAVILRVASIPDYRRRFKAVFENEDITIDTIAKAIAAFERTQLSGNSPFDRFIAGDKSAITEGQRRGWELFQGKGKCITCHEFKTSSPFFTDFKFHNTGLASKNARFDQLAKQISISSSTDAAALDSLARAQGVADLGRYLVTKKSKDIGAFKTPSLRDVELTAPYMHNGSEKTLLDMIKFYNRGGEVNPYLDENMRPLNLSYEEMNSLVEFLRSLTSDDTLRQAQTLKPQTRTAVPIIAH